MSKKARCRQSRQKFERSISKSTARSGKMCSCEVAQPEPLPRAGSEVGIDLGVTHFAALSDGTFIESPRYFRRAEKTLAKRQQVKDRRKRGSHRRERARHLVAKAHRRIANQR